MSALRRIEAGAGEILGESTDRYVELLAEHEWLHATRSRFGPHMDGADLHIHHHHTDFFYVLQGELTLMLGVEGESETLMRGQISAVPPLVVHGFRNGSDADVHFLNLHAPGQGFASFMRGLRDAQPIPYDQHDPPEEGARPTSDVVVATGTVEAESLSITGPSGAASVEGAASYYVLAGAVTLSAGNDRLALKTGDWADATIAHRAEPASSDARWLLLNMNN